MSKNYLPLTIATATSLLFGLASINAKPAQAITKTFDFDVSIDSGALVNETYSGTFSFDDSTLTGTGDEYLTVFDLGYNFLSTDYTEADALAVAEAAFSDGDFLGLSFSTNADFSFIPGFSTVDQAYFTYDVTSVGTGTGDVTYAAVPFEFSPTAGIFLIASFFGVKTAYRRYQASRVLTKN